MSYAIHSWRNPYHWSCDCSRVRAAEKGSASQEAWCMVRLIDTAQALNQPGSEGLVTRGNAELGFEKVEQAVRAGRRMLLRLNCCA